jgi:hypothetical protein
MSHVAEHLNYFENFMIKLNKKIKSKGRIYIEIPTKDTYNFPNKEDYQDKGINLIISNFYDDKTHVKTYTLEELIQITIENNFIVKEYGYIRNKYLEDIMLSYGMENNDSEITTYAMWSKLEWAEYLIIEKY